MEQIYDFMKAAWTWIAMGLLLAVFIAMDASRKRERKEKEDKE